MRPPLLAALAFAAALSGCVPPPVVPAAGATAAFDARLGQAANLGSRIVTPLAVVEDSRRPDGAQCIQAGTVRIEARVEGGADARALVLGLASPPSSAMPGSIFSPPAPTPRFRARSLRPTIA